MEEKMSGMMNDDLKIDGDILSIVDESAISDGDIVKSNEIINKMRGEEGIFWNDSIN